MGVDIIQAIRGGKASIEWGNITSEHNGHKLVLAVFRDAMKFDGMPPMTWSRTPISGDKRSFDGVRMPATGKEMQQIADLLYCMLMTPKVVDLVWGAAGDGGTQFPSVVNIKGKIVANSHIHLVHEAVEAALAKAGGDNGGFIAAVGKYWVLVNALLHGRFGKLQAVNYGWPTLGRGNGPGVTRIVNVWQTIGGRHDASHFDPSQVIRLMYRLGKLLRAGSDTWEDVDLYDVAADPELAPLISHEGVLKVVRMPCVPEPQMAQMPDGSYMAPETIIMGGDPFEGFDMVA